MLMCARTCVYSVIFVLLLFFFRILKTIHFIYCFLYAQFFGAAVQAVDLPGYGRSEGKVDAPLREVFLAGAYMRMRGYNIKRGKEKG